MTIALYVEAIQAGLSVVFIQQVKKILFLQCRMSIFLVDLAVCS